jgi:hypothetical protein
MLACGWKQADFETISWLILSLFETENDADLPPPFFLGDKLISYGNC